MTTSPTSKSALLSGAAKDDQVGLNGDFTFTISDLLTNDPGGAAKINAGTQFFFGDTAADRDNQAAYLTTHGIVDNRDGTYTLTAGATDFKYFVQIGNKGTWSQADVEVTAPEPHRGDLIFGENFDGYVDGDAPLFGVVDLNSESDWTGAAHTELGADGYGGIQTTSGDFWLDTQNSPGPIDISHAFVDLTGGKAQLSFDIGIQNLEYNGSSYATDPNAKIEFKVDGNVVAEFTAQEIYNAAGGNNQLTHFNILIDTGAPGSSHTLQLVDASSVSAFTGFSVDTIQIHDWII